MSLRGVSCAYMPCRNRKTSTDPVTPPGGTQTYTDGSFGPGWTTVWSAVLPTCGLASVTPGMCPAVVTALATAGFAGDAVVPVAPGAVVVPPVVGAVVVPPAVGAVVVPPAVSAVVVPPAVGAVVVPPAVGAVVVGPV